MSYRVAIPSYNRAAMLRDKTLAALARWGEDPGRVDVFVADEAQRKLYEATLPRGGYGRLVVAAPGMRAVRLCVQHFYEEGDRVLNLDDDLDDLVTLVSKTKTEPLTPARYADLVRRGFATCSALRLRLWGVYPVANPYFMKRRIRTDLTYIEGAVWGVVNTRSPRLSVTLDDKEDFERSILFYLADGGVIRFEDVAIKSKFYDNLGGMQSPAVAGFSPRTEDRVTRSAAELLRRYPQLCSRRQKRSGHAEVALRDRRPGRGRR